MRIRFWRRRHPSPPPPPAPEGGDLLDEAKARLADSRRLLARDRRGVEAPLRRLNEQNNVTALVERLIGGGKG